MKNIILVLSCFSFLLFNCTSNSAKSNALVGSWKVSTYDPQLQGIPSNVLESARVKTLTTSYTFNDDNTFILKSIDIPNGNKGNYIYSPDAKILELNYELEGKQTKVIYTVEELHVASSKWVQNMNQMGKIFLTLTKQ